jgi:AcrR family transcriptional regulator
VLRAAVDLADQHGIAVVTMRRLGQQLGVEAMSLYNHVADKDDLLNGMVDLVIGEVGLPAPELGWKPAIRAWAAVARTVLRRHPWALWLTKSRRRAGDATLRHHDAVIGCLREAGFAIEAAGPAYSLLRSYVYGFALHEQSMPLDTSENAADAMRRKFLRDVPAEEFPYLSELLVEHLAQHNVSHDRSFAFGLDLILDGLERVRDTA